LIDIIYKSKKIRQFLPKICGSRYQYKDDLMQFCIIKLMEKDIDKLNDKLISQKKTLEDYFIGILVNQIRSNDSEFFRVYINGGFTKSISINDNFDNEPYTDSSIDDKINKELVDDYKLSKLETILLGCDPINVDLFRMRYYEDKTYREISEYYNISHRSVIWRINSIKKKVKYILQNTSYSEVKRKERDLIRQKEGKLVITDNIKKEIYLRFKSGDTKTLLAKEYQTSNTNIAKIIKTYEVL